MEPSKREVKGEKSVKLKTPGEMAAGAADGGNVASLISGEFNAQDIADIASTLWAFATKAEERLTHSFCSCFSFIFSFVKF